jgi:hypothetical protein
MKITVTKYGEPARELDIDRIEIEQDGDMSAIVVTDADEPGILVRAFYRMEIKPWAENSIIIRSV